MMVEPINVSVISGNPFRILGLLSSSSEREITKRVTDLKMFLDLGKSPPFFLDYPCFEKVERTAEDIDDAARKIGQIEGRIFYSLFWFSINDSVDELALEVLREGNVKKASDLWQKALIKERVEFSKTARDDFLTEDDIHLSIVEKILVPDLKINYCIKQLLSDDEKKATLYDALLTEAEVARIGLIDLNIESFPIISEEKVGVDDDGSEMELDLEITRADYENVVQKVLERKLTLSKRAFSYSRNLATLTLCLKYKDDNDANEKISIAFSLLARVLHSARNMRNFATSIGGSDYSLDRNELGRKFIDDVLGPLASATSMNHSQARAFFCHFDLFPHDLREHATNKLIHAPINFINKKVAETAEKRKEDPSRVNIYGNELFKSVKDDLDTLKEILTADGLQYQRSADAVAEEIMACSIDFWNRFMENKISDAQGNNALNLAQLALSIAVSSRIRDRLHSGIRTMERWQRDTSNRDRRNKIEPFAVAIFKELDSLPDQSSASPNELFVTDKFLSACIPNLVAWRKIIQEERYSRPSSVIIETFKNNENEWSEAKGEDFIIEVTEGRCLLKNAPGSKAQWSWGLDKINFANFSTFTLECSISKLHGANDVGFGLVWGYNRIDDRVKYHNFRISGDGHYFYGMYDSDVSWQIDWKSSPDILQSDETNVLKITREYDLFKYYINDSLVTEVNDKSHMTGKSIGFRVNPGVAIAVNYLYFCNTVVEDFSPLADYQFFMEISSVVASRALGYCIDYANRTHDSLKLVSIMKTIESIDMLPEVKSHFDKNAAILKENASQQRQAQRPMFGNPKFANRPPLMIILGAIFGMMILVSIFSAITDSCSDKRVEQNPPKVAHTAVPSQKPLQAQGPVAPQTEAKVPLQKVTSPSLQEAPLPPTGSYKMYNNNHRIAPFQIKAGAGNHYLVKLVDVYTKNPVMTIFVRSGTDITTEVPLGTYEVRYAGGSNWYGYKSLFGPETLFSKADKLFEFEKQGNQVSGFTITLYKVAHGNLRTNTIRPEDF